jgi:predicted unusual protein kinase regulating ubiquinone biosynthesis (AarF/ABC1/UbiB family)
MRRNFIGRSIEYAGLAREAKKLKRDRDEVVRANARLHIVQRIGKLRGLPQKFGQMVSMRGDTEAGPVYAKLTDSSEPLPFKTIQKVLRKAWGVAPHERVKSIDPKGLAASLGQVHRAVLHDGREVAVKVRYPGIQKAVLNDLKVLGAIAGRGLGLPAGLDFAGFRQEIVRNLEEELDYRKEAEYQRRYVGLTAGMPEWIVPEVIDELSTDETLVSVWQTGERIEAAATWPEDERRLIGARLVRGCLSMMFTHGVVHADPHPGNYRFIRSGADPKIVLYDFGSVVTLTDEHRVALEEVFQIAMGKAGDAHSALMSLGFKEAVLGPVRDKLGELCGKLFQPLYEPYRYRLEWGKVAGDAAAAAGDGVLALWLALPARLLLVMRIFNGLRYYLRELKVNVDWREAWAVE